MTTVDTAFSGEPAPARGRRTEEGSRTDVGDRALIAALISGEAEAVVSVRRWIRAAAGGYRRFLAAELEDLEQEVLISLIAALEEGRFRGESRLETYVSRMVQYRCIDRMRAASRRQWIDVEDLDLPSEDTTALQQLQQEQASELALRVAASQSPECRKLWRMLHQGMSYSQMAAKIGVAAGTLRVRVLRCRRRAIQVRDQILQRQNSGKGVTG